MGTVTEVLELMTALVMLVVAVASAIPEVRRLAKDRKGRKRKRPLETSLVALPEFPRAGPATEPYCTQLANKNPLATQKRTPTSFLFS